MGKVDNAGRFVIRNANFMISQRGYLNLVGFQAESLPTLSRTDIYDLAGNELNAHERQEVTVPHKYSYRFAGAYPND